MMKIVVVFGIISGLLLSFVPSATAYVNPKNPCHNKRNLGENSDCLAPVIPPQFCNACRLKPTKPNGDFVDCKSVYEINTTECKAQFKKYAYRNPCDKLRRTQVRNYEQNIESLDYFAYSVCENCCDCVPVGAQSDLYNSYASTGTLFDVVNRANCGTHAAVDLCKVFPKVKVVVNSKFAVPSTEVLNNIPDICPPLKQWRDNRSKLPPAEREIVPEFARQFLTNFTKVARCGMESVWQRCVLQETAQGRI